MQAARARHPPVRARAAARSCACRSCTSSSARTPTPSRRPTARRCRGSSSSTRSRTSSAAGRSSTPPSIRPTTRSSASRVPDGDVPTEGAVVLDAGGAGRPGHERAPLAAARRGRSAWPGCRAALAERRRARSRSPTTARTYDGDRHDRSRSTTPKGRCCAHEPRLAFLPDRRPTRVRRAQPDGAPGARRRRALRGARRLERRGRFADRGEARLPTTVGFADVSHSRKTSCRRGDARRAALELGRATRCDGDGAWPAAHADPRARRSAATAPRRAPRCDVDRPASARWRSPARWRARRSRASARSTCARRSRRPGAARPGSVARTPGCVLCEDDGPLPDAVRRRLRRSTLGPSSRTPAGASRRRPGRRRRARPGGAARA